MAAQLNPRSFVKNTLTALGLVLTLAACAHVEKEDPRDPLESVNREIFAFNQLADEYAIEPLARGYRYITPQFARTAVNNAFYNLREPATFANSLLQAKPQAALNSFSRFFLNSTIGIGGLIDVAEDSAGLKKQSEDFGQTLASWGWTDSTFIVVPFLGPGTIRDALGQIPDYYAHPVPYFINAWETTAFSAGEALTQREALLEVTDDVKANSLDPYATYRSLYLQKRDSDIHDRSSNDTAADDAKSAGDADAPIVEK